jgi:hypothetical protein
MSLADLHRSDMPEYLIALVASVIVGYAGFIHRKADSTESSLDGFKVEVAKTYVTKQDLDKSFNHLFRILERLETKLDASVFAEVSRIKKDNPPYPTGTNQ